MHGPGTVVGQGYCRTSKALVLAFAMSLSRSISCLAGSILRAGEQLPTRGLGGFRVHVSPPINKPLPLYYEEVWDNGSQRNLVIDQMVEPYPGNISMTWIAKFWGAVAVLVGTPYAVYYNFFYDKENQDINWAPVQYPPYQMERMLALRTAVRVPYDWGLDVVSTENKIKLGIDPKYPVLPLKERMVLYRQAKREGLIRGGWVYDWV